MGNSTSTVENVLSELRHLERKVTSIHAVQRQEVEAVTQVLAEHQSDRYDRTYFMGSQVLLGPAKVIVGPVVGEVTDKTARVLLEVDRRSSITCHLCVVDKECPSGRCIWDETKTFETRRPNTFIILGLDPGLKYYCVFSGICRKDMMQRVGSFSTHESRGFVRMLTVYGNPSVHHTQLNSNNEVSVWDAVSERVAGGDISVVLHLGGQVDLRKRFERCAMILRRSSIVGSANEAVIEERVLEEFRDAYRVMWNVNGLKETLAHCSNHMSWSDLEMPASRDSSFNNVKLADIRKSGDSPKLQYSPRLLQLAKQVNEEYQLIGGKIECEMQFHKLNDHVGILLLNIRGVLETGNTRLLSDSQWTFIKSILVSQSKLKSLILSTDRPVIRCGATSSLESWMENRQDCSKLLKMIFAWKSKCQVMFVSGTGPHDYSTRTAIRAHGFPRAEIIQLAMPPMARCYQAYERTPVETLQGEVVLEDMPLQSRDFHEMQLDTVSYQHTIIPCSENMKDLVYYGIIEANESVAGMLQLVSQNQMDERPRFLIGPIVGRVSDTSAVILVEMDINCRLTCELHDSLSGKSFSQTRYNVIGRQACVFRFENLDSDRLYSISFPGLNEVSHHLFHSMPSPESMTADHQIAILFKHRDDPQNSLSSDTLWKSLDEVRGKTVAIVPTVCVHIAAQMQLEQAELDTILRHYSLSRITESELAQVTLKCKEAVKGVYRLMWNMPGTFDTLSGCSNILLSGQQKLPACFEENDDLLSWTGLIESVANEVFHEYMNLLNDTESSLILLNRITGILNISRQQPVHSSMLGSFQWAQLSETIQVQTESIRTIIIASDVPVVDDSCHDAKSKSQHSVFHKDMVSRWPFHEEECLKLLDLLFAWKDESTERNMYIIAGHSQCSFRTAITMRDSRYDHVIHQICVAPFSGHVPLLDTLPFEEEGNVELMELVGDQLREPKYKFKHTPLSGCVSEQAFGILTLENIGKQNTCRMGLNASEDLLSFPNWVFGVLKVGEDAYNYRTSGASILKERKETRIQNETQEADIKAQYPDLVFPEASFEMKDVQVEISIPIFDSTDIKFKWLRCDFGIYGPSLHSRLRLYLNHVTDNQSYFDSVRSVYSRNAEEGGGVPISSIPSLISKYFVRECDETIRSLCLNPNASSDGNSLLMQMVSHAVLLRHGGDVEDMLTYPDILSLCSAAGALALLCIPSLNPA